MTFDRKSFWRYPQCDRGVRITSIERDEDEPYFGVFDEDAYAYKKVRLLRNTHNDDERAVVLLMVPAGALVYLTDTKCRVSEAVTLGYHIIFSVDFDVDVDLMKPIDFLTKNQHKLSSLFAHHFRYVMGRRITPRACFSDAHDKCSSGIHVYRTYMEAYNH